MIILYSHGGSQNHGCEAIVRSTCHMLAQISEQKTLLYSNHIEQDLRYGVDELCDLEEDSKEEIRRGSWKWFLSSLETKTTGKYHKAVEYQHAKLLRNIRKNDLCISIGGDNYCYPGTDILGSVNRAIRKKGAKTVLWGCSVEPALLTESELIRDLADFDLICARETISFEALKKVNQNVVLAADPAFTLKSQKLPLPENWKEGNTIGINASPLILSSSADSDLTIQSYEKLIDYILTGTDANIALIPHVVWKSNDDRQILSQLYRPYKDNRRVILLDDYNCMELKGFISRCRFFIGSRTHATIAAYSTCVPTLVLGYSVKSRGIARDIFGTEEHFVIPVQNIRNTDVLTDEFRWIMDHEEEIRMHLQTNMPAYIATAAQACEALKEIL